ncbi:DUF6400 family protein [Streptomyces anandii]|uniref:DUF6400 family protein n=1 Tax=Streptomyces anandii TaxID=285454 RepID=UPI001679CECB|nr:DUF6400 family protein [Streptomyces anandii]GGX77640.1 hypothetical protein GCM10010510_23180 [Streptomyces anandii JCM 4720]
MSSHGPVPPGEPAQPVPSDTPAPPADFSFDLDAHEMLRRTHVLAALGSDWDPVAAMRGEEEAYDLLYSGLSPEQQRIHDELVAAGVLPRRGGRDAAA